MCREERRRGNRCHICTGCGRCFGGAEKLRVLTDSIWTGGAGLVCAVDLGTTTIAMALYEDGRELDRFAAVNPQTAYGADVLSRISAARERAAAEDMRRSVLGLLEQGIRGFREEAGEAGTALKNPIVISANTVMAYFLMGWDPEELGKSPFHVSHPEAGRLTLDSFPAVVMPGFSAFVGGDILAGIMACGLHRREEPSLLIDLGTNGEMVLGNRKHMLACSTAAGPAFEGGATKGIWGADMVSLTARLLREGALDDSGLLQEPYFDGGIRIGGARITQQNIRDLQLAKGAAAAGTEILARLWGLRSLAEVEHVFLAGGFGYYLNAADAAEIGLLPAELAEKCIPVGNAALAGAAAFAADPDWEELGRIRRLVQTVNLAGVSGFNDSFLQQLDLKKSVCFGVNN